MEGNKGGEFFTTKAKKEGRKTRRLVYLLSMIHKSELDYNNEELGTTKAHRTYGLPSCAFALPGSSALPQ
jgi:hypothetical protein